MTVRKPGPLSIIQYWYFLVLRFSIRIRILILEIGKHFSPHFSFTLRKLKKTARNRQFEFKNSFVSKCVKEGGPKGSKENSSNYFRDRLPGLRTLHKCKQDKFNLLTKSWKLEAVKRSIEGDLCSTGRVNVFTFIGGRTLA